MTSKFVRISMTTAFALSMAALAQTNSAAAAAPSPAAPSPAPATTNAAGTKIGTINVEQAIYATNEGQRDFEALGKKLEPKQNELKNLNDEVDGLKKQLSTQGDKLNDESRSSLVKQVELKQKSLERAVQDARDDAQNQQNEIAQRILQKMAPLLVKYAGDNGFGVIIDTSNPWPQGPVLWAGPAVDITKPVVDAYNAQSGVPAPTPSAPKPGTVKPGGTGTKPPAPSTPKPQGGTQPK
ncbi:MAG TPA: OmpH family outer membrane protein [Terriglobales bacterium]|nr:OmpH family outer membrane protein [Terriglobales bacterium]